MASLFRDARAIFLTNVISALAGLGSQSLLAWFLLPEGRGQYGACLLFVTLVTLACTFGQEMANTYYVGAKKLTASQAFTQSLFLGAATCALACAVGYVLTLTGLKFLDKAPLAWFRWSLVCVPSLVFHLYLTRILLGLSDMSAFTCLTALPPVVETFALAVVAGFSIDVKTAIGIHAGADALGALLAWGILRFRHGCRLTPLRAEPLLRSLSYGGRFYVGKLISFANVHIATLVLLMSAVGQQEIGLFAAATAMASRLWMVCDALHMAMLPRTASDPSGKSLVIAQVTRLCLLASAVVVLGAYVFSKPLIHVILSPRFLAVLIPFQLLLPGIWIRVIPKILTAYFSGIDRPGINSVAMMVSAGVNIVLLLLLLPVWGLTGAALSTTVAYTLEAIFLATLFRRLSGLPIHRILWPSAEDWAMMGQLWRRFTIGLRNPHRTASSS